MRRISDGALEACGAALGKGAKLFPAACRSHGRRPSPRPGLARVETSGQKAEAQAQLPAQLRLRRPSPRPGLAFCGLFSCKIFCKINAVAFLFVFDKYCSIID